MNVSIAVPQGGKNNMGGRASALRVQQNGGGRAVLARTMLMLGEPRPASNSRRMAEWQAQHQPRYRIGDGKGLYLRGDGQGVTDCSREAWFGSEAQADKALVLFSAAAGMRALRVIDGKVPHRSVIRQLWGSE